MEQLAGRVGAALAAHLEMSAEQQEIVAFGALVFLQNGTTLAATLGAGALTGALPQTAAAMATAAVMRHASGGLHVRTPMRCVVTSALVFLLCAHGGRLATAALVGNAIAWWAATAVLLALALAPVARHAPVSAETRPLSPPHQRQLRRLALQLSLLAVILFAAGGLWQAGWVFPGLLALCFQGFTLTSPGRRFIHALDRFLDR